MERLNREQKITYLQKADLGLFIKTRKTVFKELSEQQTSFCCCGLLASSWHEKHCAKFNNKVADEVIKRLSYLLPNNKSKLQ